MDRDLKIQKIVEGIFKCQRPVSTVIWKRLGLSHAQVGMLYMLYYHHQSNVKQIAQYLGISKSAVTQLMDPLVDKALVSRKVDDKDRRIIRLALTAKGKQSVNKLSRLKFDGFREALSSLSDKELDQLAQLHQKMISNINYQK